MNDLGETRRGTGEHAFNEVLLSRIAADDPPDATVLWTSPSPFGVRTALEPFDELLTASTYSQLASWPESVLASCQWEGRAYGLPATAGTNAMVYNQELFESKGFPPTARGPKTWTELWQLSREFTVWDGITLVSMGALPRPADAVEFANLSACNGSQLFDTTNQQDTIDSLQNDEMMEFFIGWLDEEYQGDYQTVVALDNWKEITDAGKPPAA